MEKKLKYMASSLVVTALVGLGLCQATTASASPMSSKIDYMQPSETIDYPDITQIQKLNVLVRLHKNRVYIRSGDRVVYTMYCSGGVTNPKTGRSTTPEGHFKIQSEQGKTFYNSQLKEGANYWTSFKDHGVYLFHTVPTDQNGNYKPAEAVKLGKEPASHGCIRLSIPDAKYIQTLPVNTPVTIEP